MKKLFALFVTALIVILAIQGTASAQMAPTPQKSPRTPVNRQALPDHKPALPASHTLEGQATVIDSERLRIGDTDLHLFGIVSPQLSASFGPQTRAALDSLVSGQTISCLVRDRDQNGHYLATCRTGNTDLAQELLRRGLAVTARGSLTSTDLSAPYLAAEQAAQMQKTGLWSVAVPTPASISTTAPKTETAAIPAPPTPAALETKKDDKAAKLEENKTKPISEEVSAKTAAMLAASARYIESDEPISDSSTPGFVERYQLLITGFIMLMTALAIFSVVSARSRNEKREEIKAIAAALRGELMAARAVCQTRVKSILTESDDKSVPWPRIRTTLYQAYVGRLGWLGAELARQVASIYGQASDYAAYYGDNREGKTVATPKRVALQAIADYIDEVLPRLYGIEQTGHVSHAQGTFTPPPSAEEVMASPDRSTSIFNAMRAFAQLHFGDKKGGPSPEAEGDYDALIEEEMKTVSFTATDDDADLSMPNNITKLHGT